MAILANPSYFEQEQAGNTEQILAAVRYVGPSRSFTDPSTYNQGRWPADTTFLQGVWYVGFVPETTPEGDPGVGIAWFERNSNFEVELSPEGIAEVLLNRNYLDLDPGGPIGDGESVPGFDEKVAEGLGLEDPIEAGAPYEDQLREMAGVEEAPATSEKLSEEERLVNEYGRDELKEMVKDVREDAEEFSLRGASMEDMAEFLVSKGVES